MSGKNKFIKKFVSFAAVVALLLGQVNYGYAVETEKILTQQSNDDTMVGSVKVQGDKVGPVIEEHIIEQVKECHLSYETLVWKRGMTEWKTVDESEIGINKPVFKENGMSYLCLIVMVCMPIINTILWNLVDVYGLSPFIRILGFVPLIFWDVDWHYLKSLGIRGAWRIWGFFLPPVYLFIRAKKTNKNYVWGIVAVVVLLLMVLV